MEIFTLHKEDVLTPCVPVAITNFAVTFGEGAEESGGTGEANPLRGMKRDRLQELTRMRELLVGACQYAANHLNVSPNPCASPAPEDPALPKMLALSRYGDLTRCAQRVALLQEYLVQWKTLVSTLGFRAGQLRTRHLPLFSWRSGVDGRAYHSTCLAFETVMVGHALAAQLYNVQQHLGDLMQTGEDSQYVTEDLQTLYLYRTAEAYRALHQVCLRELEAARHVLLAEAEADQVEDAVLQGAKGRPGYAPPQAMRALPPECATEFCHARMSFCVLRMHHLNSKRLLLRVLSPSKAAPPENETPEAASERLHLESLGGMGWNCEQLRQASALDLALACQWTQRQLTAVHAQLRRAGMLPKRAAASLLGAGPTNAPLLQCLAPRWEALRGEAFAMKEVAVCCFLQDTRALVAELCDPLVSPQQEEQAKKQLSGRLWKMYAGWSANKLDSPLVARRLLALFSALVELGGAEMEALCYGVAKPALQQLDAYRRSAWLPTQMVSLQGMRRALLARPPAPRVRDLEMGPEEAAQEGQEEEEEPDALALANVDAVASLAKKRLWSTASVEALKDGNILESTAVGMLAARLEQQLDVWRTSVDNNARYFSEEQRKNLHICAVGLHELFTGAASRQHLLAQQFYGYREPTVMENLSRPLLPELQQQHTPLRFAD